MAVKRADRLRPVIAPFYTVYDAVTNIRNDRPGLWSSLYLTKQILKENISHEQKEEPWKKRFPHDDHSDSRKRRLKRPETTIKRRITALIFTVFRRNPSYHFTSRFFPSKMTIVSPRFCLRFLVWRITALFSLTWATVLVKNFCCFSFLFTLVFHQRGIINSISYILPIFVKK